MEEVGLGYLQLDRSATTLSGGESQRIRLAAQLGSNLRGVLYVLDEPTIGLHPRDNAKLLETLVGLREKGNSLVVVEHDEDTIRRADHLIDLGRAGQYGGEVVWQGDPKTLFSGEVGGRRSEIGLESPTREAFAHPLVHPLRGSRRKLPAKKSAEDWLVVKGARANNLKNLEVRVPVGRLTVITAFPVRASRAFLRGVLKPAVTEALAAAKTVRKPAAKTKGRAKSAPAALGRQSRESIGSRPSTRSTSRPSARPRGRLRRPT